MQYLHLSPLKSSLENAEIFWFAWFILLFALSISSG